MKIASVDTRQMAIPVGCDEPMPSPLAKELPLSHKIKPPEIVRAEANFLRFPFFALHTKGLRQRDGVECIGRKQDGERVHVFKLTITRNTKHLYPGPLSRKTHVALLSIQQERGLPYPNTVEWSWPQLTDRIGITCSGEIQAKLKDAIRRTAGVLITSNYALTAAIGGKRHLLPSDEHGYHLYDGYRFRNERLHDGTIADRNCVWLSDWYLTNLNSLYSGPVHHATWLALDAESSVASRLYEFLLFNSKATDCLRIDYATLVNFLPLKMERYPSDAERQLADAFRLAREKEVLDDATWTLGIRGQLQLMLRFGSRLTGVRRTKASRESNWPDFSDDVEIRELRNGDTPAADLVRQFHRLWSGSQNYRPMKSELAFATDLLESHDLKHVENLLPKVVRAMQRPDGFPTAKMFTAARRFFHELSDHDKRKEERRRRDDELARREVAEEFQANTLKQSRYRRREELLALWNGLTPEARARLEDQARGRQQGALLSDLFLKSETHRLRECLKELDRQTLSIIA